jgi:hypothetical protein
VPRLSHLTRPKLIEIGIDVGDGDVITITFDRNKVTAYWAHQTQEWANSNDILAVGRALTEVITAWNVTDDQDQPLPLTAENVSRLTLSGQQSLTEKIMEASVPGEAEGKASPATAAVPSVVSSPIEPMSPNGPASSPSPMPSESPSPT